MGDPEAQYPSNASTFATVDSLNSNGHNGNPNRRRSADACIPGLRRTSLQKMRRMSSKGNMEQARTPGGCSSDEARQIVGNMASGRSGAPSSGRSDSNRKGGRPVDFQSATHSNRSTERSGHPNSGRGVTKSQLTRSPTMSATAFRDRLKENVTSATTNLTGGGGQAAGHLRAHDIVHVNTHAATLIAWHYIMFGHPVLVLITSLLLYVSCVFIFAGMFYAFGDQCFRLEEEFNFETMLWISTHVFSTVGFGNIAPLQSCVGAQLVVIFEVRATGSDTWWPRGRCPATFPLRSVCHGGRWLPCGRVLTRRPLEPLDGSHSSPSLLSRQSAGPPNHHPPTKVGSCSCPKTQKAIAHGARIPYMAVTSSRCSFGRSRVCASPRTSCLTTAVRNARRRLASHHSATPTHGGEPCGMLEGSGGGRGTRGR